MAKNLRWKVLTIVGGRRPGGLGVLSARQKDQPRPRPQGRRAPGDARPDRRRAEARDGDDRRSAARAAEDREHPGRRRHRGRARRRSASTGVPPDQDAAFRNAARPTSTSTTTAAPAPAATPSRSSRTSSSSCARTRSNQALQTIERRVNELGVAEPIVARHSAADQILVQLPGVTDVNRAKEIIRSTAQLELKLVEQGPFSDENAARAGVRQQRCRPTCRFFRARSKRRPASRPAPATTSCAACRR